MATRKERRDAERDREREEQEDEDNNKSKNRSKGKGKRTQKNRKGGKGKANPKSRSQEGNKPKGPVIHQVLPPEILLHIFTLASASPEPANGEKRTNPGVAILLKCRLVCKEWRAFCADSTLPLRARLEGAKIGNGAPFIWSREITKSSPTLLAEPFAGSQFEWDSDTHILTHIDTKQARKELWKSSVPSDRTQNYSKVHNTALVDMIWWSSQDVLIVRLQCGDLHLLKVGTGELQKSYTYANLQQHLGGTYGEIKWMGIAEENLLLWCTGPSCTYFT